MMHTTSKDFKRGFTMLELVFVITILGIVSSIAASLIAQVYESYIVQRALHRTSVKAEVAAMQIANRLTYRISSGVIGRVPGSNLFKPIEELQPADSTTHTALEWIAYDNDSFDMSATPGWSGFCDVNVSTKTSISTPGSKLSDTSAITGILGATAGDTDLAIVFAGHEYNTTKNYHASCMGFTDNSCIFRVNANITNDTVIPIADSGSGIVMTDQYKLAWSAYAVVPSQITVTTLIERGFKSTDKIYDLYLYYDYQPWKTNTASSYANSGAQSSLLVTNVKSFRFIGKGDTVRFKICVIESIGDSNITSCKEKAVIR